MIEAILKIKTTLEEAATEFKQVVNFGVRPGYEWHVYSLFGENTAEPTGQLLRAEFTQPVALFLDYLIGDPDLQHFEVIRVEWPALEPEGGWPSVIVDLVGTNEDGTEYAYQQEVGKFA